MVLKAIIVFFKILSSSELPYIKFILYVEAKLGSKKQASFLALTDVRAKEDLSSRVPAMGEEESKLSSPSLKPFKPFLF